MYFSYRVRSISSQSLLFCAACSSLSLSLTLTSRNWPVLPTSSPNWITTSQDYLFFSSSAFELSPILHKTTSISFSNIHRSYDYQQIWQPTSTLTVIQDPVAGFWLTLVISVQPDGFVVNDTPLLRGFTVSKAPLPGGSVVNDTPLPRGFTVDDTIVVPQVPVGFLDPDQMLAIRFILFLGCSQSFRRLFNDTPQLCNACLCRLHILQEAVSLVYGRVQSLSTVTSLNDCMEIISFGSESGYSSFQSADSGP